MSCFSITPPSLPETRLSLQCVHLKMSSAACVIPRKGTAADQLQLHWLRNLEMWVKIGLVIIMVVIFDPLLQGGGGSWRLQALDTRAS